MTDPTSSSQPAVDPALTARVKGILLQPVSEWRMIDGEFATIKTLFTRYAMILAAIGPVATLIGSVAFGHASIVSALVLAIVSYGLNLAGVYLLGLIINALASSFGSTPNPVQAMKLAVYASTASWIAGVFNLIPALGALTIIGGVYSLVLLFLGLPILMKVPEDKKVVYFIVVLIAGIVLGMVMAAIIGAIALTFVASTAGLAAMGAGY